MTTLTAPAHAIHHLAPRELDVLQLTAAGMSGPAIGRTLSLSAGTVASYLRSARTKLGAYDSRHAAALAIQYKLMSPPAPAALPAAELTARQPAAELTARQLEALRLAAAGQHQHEIAALLGIHRSAVEQRMRGVRRKLGAASTAKAIKAARRVGILPGSR